MNANPFKFNEEEAANLLKCWNACLRAIEENRLGWQQRQFLCTLLSNDLFLDMTATLKPDDNA